MYNQAKLTATVITAPHVALPVPTSIIHVSNAFQLGMFLAIQFKGTSRQRIFAVQAYLELRLTSRAYKASIRRGDARGAYEKRPCGEPPSRSSVRVAKC